jgi:tetraacyldisaccharide 4'-kinase
VVPTRTVAFAGIAQPAPFFRSLADAGWTIVRELRFGDHHRYMRSDMAAIVAAAREAAVDVVVTTEKDLVRLLPFRPFPIAIAYPPLGLAVEPAAPFDDWLRARIEDARR